MDDSVAIFAVVSLACLGVLAALGVLGRVVFNNPRGDFESGAMLVMGRAYVRALHRLRVRGADRIPERTGEPNETTGAEGVGPLIIVANHTAGVDPVLIQSAVPFYVRWMMAADMGIPLLDWFWRWWGVIFVDRENPGSAGLRQAIRHLRDGGVIGIFPEGGLERPPRQVMPFQEGIGVLIKRTGARVLPVTIDGTPQYDPAWASLWRASESTIHFREIIDYANSDIPADQIAEDLRRRFLNWTGWPANDSPPPWQVEADAPGYGRSASPESEKLRRLHSRGLPLGARGGSSSPATGSNLA
ncbi:MAG: hypothetical protein CMJ31_12995 [Phycisphaerae bacterium]|nr:hypothetical protein [Phycisphaerae bacterium]